MERPSRRAFLIVPADAAILTAHDGLTDEGFFNQALRPVNDSPVSPASWTTMGTASPRWEIRSSSPSATASRWSSRRPGAYAPGRALPRTQSLARVAFREQPPGGFARRLRRRRTG
jgi:hypothetical protein